MSAASMVSASISRAPTAARSLRRARASPAAIDRRAPKFAFAPTTRSVRGFARRLVVAAVVVPRKSEDAPKGGERASSSPNLDDVMRNVRASLRLDDRGVASSGMTWGHGVFLGDPVRWALRHDAGSFAEEAAGPDLSYVSTHCAGADEVWETDHTGYTQVVQLDDHEASLLAAWARTGWWAHPDAKHDVELELGGGAAGDAADDEARPAPHECEVTIRLRAGGLIVASMYVDTREWLPTRMRMRVCGDDESWFYEDWKNVGGSNASAGAAKPYPALTTLKGAAGGTQTFRTDGARANSGVGPGYYRRPGTLPGDAFGSFPAKTQLAATDEDGFDNAGSVRFDAKKRPEVNIEEAKSSHVLVRPLIDGVDVGPFILDTGASGLVISGAAAERLNLRKFGEVWVSGVAGKVPCNFRRGDTLELGPITIDAPVFMEMSVGGIVSGSSEPVAGIVGFDVFKSAILEVGPGGSPVRLYDPQKFIPPVTWDWKPLLMVSNVPHVAASFAGAPRGKPQIFMIDSGAGGADCIFHARAVREMNLEKLLPGTKRASSRVRGVGGSGGESSGATRAYRGSLDWLELCSELPCGVSGGGFGCWNGLAEGAGGGDAFEETVGDVWARAGTGAMGGRFDTLDVLLASDAGFDLSEHSCGLICANALNSRRVVYDLPNRRIALLKDGVDEPVPCEGLLCPEQTFEAAWVGPGEWEFQEDDAPDDELTFLSDDEL